MSKRESYRVVVPSFVQRRLAEGRCPVCGLKQEEWKRKSSVGRCCSTKCTGKYWSIVRLDSSAKFREKVFERDGLVCKECKREFSKVDLEVDHILAIGLGGDEWCLSNLQVLCKACHRIKTNVDISKIRDSRK